MNLYMISKRRSDWEHVGYQYVRGKREAMAIWRRRPEGCDWQIEKISVRVTRAGVLAALNRYGGHADNG